MRTAWLAFFAIILGLAAAVLGALGLFDFDDLGTQAVAAWVYGVWFTIAVMFLLAYSPSRVLFITLGVISVVVAAGIGVSQRDALEWTPGRWGLLAGALACLVASVAFAVVHTKAKAQPARIEAQPARIEAQPARIEAQPARIEAQPATLSGWGMPVESTSADGSGIFAPDNPIREVGAPSGSGSGSGNDSDNDNDNDERSIVQRSQETQQSDAMVGNLPSHKSIYDAARDGDAKELRGFIAQLHKYAGGGNDVRDSEFLSRVMQLARGVAAVVSDKSNGLTRTEREYFQKTMRRLTQNVYSDASTQLRQIMDDSRESASNESIVSGHVSEGFELSSDSPHEVPQRRTGSASPVLGSRARTLPVGGAGNAQAV